MNNFDFSEYEEIRKAMEINNSVQMMYRLFLSAMGVPEKEGSLVTGTSDISLTNTNASTLGCQYAKYSCDLSRNL